MEEWQQRVIDERAALDTRHQKLDNFCRSPAFQNVNEQERVWMSRQHAAERELLYALDQRIKVWG